MKVAKQNIGNAGEYFVAYLLSANNCIVTVTLGRAEGFDLLIVNPKNKTLKISVKTTFYKIKSLMMTKKVEELKTSDLFYAFVILKPLYWISSGTSGNREVIPKFIPFLDVIIDNLKLKKIKSHKPNPAEFIQTLKNSRDWITLDFLTNLMKRNQLCDLLFNNDG